MADNIQNVYDVKTGDLVNPATIARAVKMDNGSTLEDYLQDLKNNLESGLHAVSSQKSNSQFYITYYKYIHAKEYNKDLKEFDFLEDVKPGKPNNGWLSIKTVASEEGVYRWKRLVLCKTVGGVQYYDTDRDYWQGIPELDEPITTTLNVQGGFINTLYKLTLENDVHKIIAPEQGSELDSYASYYNNSDQWHRCNLERYLKQPGQFIYGCDVRCTLQDNKFIIDPSYTPVIYEVCNFYDVTTESIIYWVKENFNPNNQNHISEQQSWIQSKINLGSSTIESLKIDKIQNTPILSQNENTAVYACTLIIDSQKHILEIGEVNLYHTYTPTIVTYSNIINYPKIWGISTCSKAQGEKDQGKNLINSDYFLGLFNKAEDHSSALKFSDNFLTQYTYIIEETSGFNSIEEITYWFADEASARNWFGKNVENKTFQTLWSSILTVYGDFVSTCTVPENQSQLLNNSSNYTNAQQTLHLYLQCEYNTNEFFSDKLNPETTNIENENDYWNNKHKLYPDLNTLRAVDLEKTEGLKLSVVKGSNGFSYTHTSGPNKDKEFYWVQDKPNPKTDYPYIYEIEVRFISKTNIYNGTVSLGPNVTVTVPRCVSNYADAGARGVLGQISRIRLLSALLQAVDSEQENKRNIWIFSSGDQRNFKELPSDNRPSDGDVIIPTNSDGREAYALYYDIVADDISIDDNGNRQIIYYKLNAGENSHKFKNIENGITSDNDWDVKKIDSNKYEFNPDQWVSAEESNFIHVQTALIEELIVDKETANSVLIRSKDAGYHYSAGMFNGADAFSIIDGYTGLGSLGTTYDEITKKSESDIRIFAGNFRAESAGNSEKNSLSEMPFRVYEDGTVVATKFITTEGSIILGTDGQKNTFSTYLANRIGQSKEEQEKLLRDYQTSVENRLNDGNIKYSNNEYALVNIDSSIELKKRDPKTLWHDGDVYYTTSNSNDIIWKRSSDELKTSAENQYLILRIGREKYKRTKDGTKFIKIQKIKETLDADTSGSKPTSYRGALENESWLTLKNLIVSDADDDCQYEFDVNYSIIQKYSDVTAPAFHFNLWENQVKDEVLYTLPEIPHDTLLAIRDNDICISFEAKKDNEFDNYTTSFIYFDLKPIKSTNPIQGARIFYNHLWDAKQQNLNSTWQKYEFTIKFDKNYELSINGEDKPYLYKQSDGNNGSDEYGNPQVYQLDTKSCYISFGVHNENNITASNKGVFQLRNCKLELGTTSSDWCQSINEITSTKIELTRSQLIVQKERKNDQVAYNAHLGDDKIIARLNINDTQTSNYTIEINSLNSNDAVPITFSQKENEKNALIFKEDYETIFTECLNNNIFSLAYIINVTNNNTKEVTALRFEILLNNSAEISELVTTYGKTTSAVQDLFTYNTNSEGKVECKNAKGESNWYFDYEIEQKKNENDGYMYVQRDVTNFTNRMDINSFITSSIHSAINSDGSTKVTGYEVGFDYKTKEEGGYEINPDSTHAYFAVDKFEVKVPTSNALNPFTGRTIMHVSEDDVYFSGNLKSESTTIRKIGTYDNFNIESIITGGNFNKTSRKILKVIKRVSNDSYPKDQVFIHPNDYSYVVLKRKLGAHNPFFIFSSKELGDKIQEVNPNIKLFEMYGSYVYFIQNHNNNTLWWYSEKVEDDKPGWYTAPIDTSTFECNFDANNENQNATNPRYYFKVSGDMLYAYTYGNAYNVGASIEMDSLDYITDLGGEENEVHQSMFEQTSTYFDEHYDVPRAYFTEENPDYLKYLIEVPSSIYYKNSASDNSIPFSDSYDLESCYEVIDEEPLTDSSGLSNDDSKHINLLETEQIIQFGMKCAAEEFYYLDLPYISSNTTTENHFISGETMQLYSNLGNNIIVHNTISNLVFNFDFILLNDSTYELHTTHNLKLDKNTTYSIECKFMSGMEPQGNSYKFGPGIYWVVSKFSNTKQKES